MTLERWHHSVRVWLSLITFPHSLLHKASPSPSDHEQSMTSFSFHSVGCILRLEKVLFVKNTLTLTERSRTWKRKLQNLCFAEKRKKNKVYTNDGFISTISIENQSASCFPARYLLAADKDIDVSAGNIQHRKLVQQFRNVLDRSLTIAIRVGEDNAQTFSELWKSCSSKLTLPCFYSFLFSICSFAFQHFRKIISKWQKWIL